jgi:hypothetical protein
MDDAFAFLIFRNFVCVRDQVAGQMLFFHVLWLLGKVKNEGQYCEILITFIIKLES